MDEIQLAETEVPGLRPGEVAYQVDDHTVVAVRVRRREAAEPEFIAFGAAARLVNGATGESCRCVADTPLEAPENTTTIPLDLIAGGRLDLAAEVEKAKRRAVQRVLHLRAALQCLDVLPEVSE